MDILLILISVFGLSFFIAYLYTARQLRITTQHLAETILLYLSSAESLAESNQDQPDIDKTHKESFIKFLSDSRDWAFEYIEKTQKTITYYNKYGAAVEGMITPHDKALKKISKEIYELKNLLPEDIDDRR